MIFIRLPAPTCTVYPPWVLPGLVHSEDASNHQYDAANSSNGESLMAGSSLAGTNIPGRRGKWKTISRHQAWWLHGNGWEKNANKLTFKDLIKGRNQTIRHELRESKVCPCMYHDTGCKSFHKRPRKSSEFGKTHSKIKRPAIVLPPILPSLYVVLSKRGYPQFHWLIIISLLKIAIWRITTPFDETPSMVHPS